MLVRILQKKIAALLLILLVFSCFFNVSNSYAIYEGVRDDMGVIDDHCTYHSDNQSAFPFDPLASNKDSNWQLDNPTCLAFMSIQGAAIVVASKAVTRLCKGMNASALSRAGQQEAADSLPDVPTLNPGIAHKLAVKAGFCSGMIADYVSWSVLAATDPSGYSTSQATLASSDSIRCCSSYAAYAGAVGVGVSTLALIYNSARQAFLKARVCGENWNKWAKVDVNGELDTSPDAMWRYGKYDGSYQKCIEDLFIKNANTCGLSSVNGITPTENSLKNKYYREYLYGGIEYEDHGGGACALPDDKYYKRIDKLGYDSGNQRYYMQGPGVASNYACYRFAPNTTKTPEERAAMTQAFECCKERSQTTICIENNDFQQDIKGPVSDIFDTEADYKFCKLGSRCEVKNVWFDTYMAKTKPNFICAKTYSVCPYNHLLGGGTETYSYKKDANGKETSEVENYCQVMKHCAKIPVPPYIKITTLDNAFISSACRDMVGDSQNVYGFNIDLLPIKNRGFSAPIVQCFKETMDNLLLNKAGYTKCRNPEEFPNKDGICGSDYFFKKGLTLDSKSFFLVIQEKLRFIIMLALTVAIMFFGAMTLLAMNGIKKKDLLMYILKIGLVVFFALGEGWQTGFVEGVLGTSNTLAQIMVQLDATQGENTRDGCQFPRYNYQDSNETTKYNNPKYPPGKDYLAIWDTFDCKLARALGFGPEVSVPNLVKMILAGFITKGLGIVFLIATFMFAFFMFSMILRAIHIFLISSLAIVILIYISPITITLAMFSKTKMIFDSWWKQLIGLALQPVILFAYLGILICLFDSIVIGSATFEGSGKSEPKKIICNDQAENDSIYCIFRVAKLRTYSGLEVIGIGIPILISLNKDKLDTIIKGAFTMFVFYSFMDQVSLLAARLVGTDIKIHSQSPSAIQMASKAYGAARGIQKRGARFIIKQGLPRAKRALSYGKNSVRKMGNKGKGKVNKPTSNQSGMTP